MEYNEKNQGTDHITLPYIPKDELIKSVIEKALNK